MDFQCFFPENMRFSLDFECFFSSILQLQVLEMELPRSSGSSATTEASISAASRPSDISSGGVYRNAFSTT